MLDKTNYYNPDEDFYAYYPEAAYNFEKKENDKLGLGTHEFCGGCRVGTEKFRNFAWISDTMEKAARLCLK